MANYQMTDHRIELHNRLVSLLGSSRVYFQPPESVKLQFPCIIYTLDRTDVWKANNAGYLGKNRYSVTIISKDPDYDLPRQVAMLPLCSFSRFFTVDNLNHWTYEIYC